MFLAVFVVQKGLLSQTLLQCLSGDGDGAVRGNLSVEHSHLQGVQGGAGVSVCEYRHTGEQIVLHTDRAAAKAPGIPEGVGKHGSQILRIQLL